MKHFEEWKVWNSNIILQKCLEIFLKFSYLVIKYFKIDLNK